MQWVSKGLSVMGGGTSGLMPFAPVSAWEGIPIRVDWCPYTWARARQPLQAAKNFKLWVTTLQCSWAGVGIARKPLYDTCIAYNPM